MKIFNSVAQMKLATIKAGQYVETFGYYAKGDAGAARYLVVTSQVADEKGDHTLANGTVAVLQVGTEVNVKQFGAIGDGVADDTLAIQAALTRYRYVTFGDSSDFYNISSAIVVPDNTTLKGNWSRAKQLTDNTEIFNVENKVGISITNFDFIGKGTDYIDSDGARGAAVYGGVGGGRITVNYNKFTGFTYTSARFKSQANCSFVGNVVVGPDATVVTSSSVGRIYGVLFDSGCSFGVISHNIISQGAQGMRLEQSNNLSVSDNVIHNILGQHAVYCGSNMQEIVISNNIIFDTRLQGIKVQAQDASGADNENISIIGNTLRNCTDQAIFVGSSESPAVQHCRNVTIAGNTVWDAGGQGIYTDSTIGAVISGNTIISSGQSGIVLDEVDDVIVIGNLIKTASNSGIRDIAACSNITIKDNIIKDCCVGNVAGDEYGIFINSNSINFVIDGNVITDSAANMERAMYLNGTINATSVLTNNYCPDSTASGLRLGTTVAFKKFSGNIFKGAFNDPLSVAVPSAATLVLPQGQDVYSITGTTNITNITATGHSGRVVTLVFSGALTLADTAGTFNGAFVAAASSTFTIACRNGTNWFEVSRSAN